MQVSVLSQCNNTNLWICKQFIIYFGKSMKKIIVSFSSLPTITQGTSPTHRPIIAYRKPFRIARLSGVARGATGAMPPPHPTASRWLTRIVFRNRYASFIDRQGRARPPIRSCQCHCLAAGHCLTWSHPVGLSFGRVPVFVRERRYYVQHDHLQM